MWANHEVSKPQSHEKAFETSRLCVFVVIKAHSFSHSFSILGNSGGGAYAAVCAAKIPERLRAVVIVSGGWQMNWPEALDNLPPRQPSIHEYQQESSLPAADLSEDDGRLTQR